MKEMESSLGGIGGGDDAYGGGGGGGMGVSGLGYGEGRRRPVAEDYLDIS
jgi:hypothetical protein